MSKIKIGSIGVDAGMCFIGDPCYTLPDDASQRTILDADGNDLWNSLIKEMGNKLHTSMSYRTKNRFNEHNLEDKMYSVDEVISIMRQYKSNLISSLSGLRYYTNKNIFLEVIRLISNIIFKLPIMANKYHIFLKIIFF